MACNSYPRPFILISTFADLNSGTMILHPNDILKKSLRRAASECALFLNIGSAILWRPWRKSVSLDVRVQTSAFGKSVLYYPAPVFGFVHVGRHTWSHRDKSSSKLNWPRKSISVLRVKLVKLSVHETKKDYPCHLRALISAQPAFQT